MTKEEAIKAMAEGKKVTHQYMDPHEYISMREYESGAFDSSIYWCSDKHQVTSKMFWHDRSGQHWNDGWQIFNPSNQKK